MVIKARGNMSEKIPQLLVTDDENGMRLDRWFRRRFPALSHGGLQKLLRTGQVRVNGKRAEASDRLAAGQNIRVPPQAAGAEAAKAQAKTRVERTTRDLKKLILFEDDDVLAFNKPPGLAVQGGSGLKENLDDMLESLGKQGKKPKLVHRLDRDTSGVLLVAKTHFAAVKLSEAFRERATEKIYWGVTRGVPKMERGKISAPLVKRGELMKVAEGEEEREEAKSATTLYQILERAKGQAAFVAMWPLSGRTHQLRVHMQYIGTPLLGDRYYGADAASARDISSALPVDELGKGLHLHARRLVIPHPRRGVIDVVAPLPPDMQKTWKWFGFDANAEADFADA